MTSEVYQALYKIRRIREVLENFDNDIEYGPALSDVEKNQLGVEITDKIREILS